MKTLIGHLESIAARKRKKQIRINGRQVMVTPDMAIAVIAVHDQLGPGNQAWFVKLDASRMIDLAQRLHAMTKEREIIPQTKDTA